MLTNTCLELRYYAQRPPVLLGLASSDVLWGCQASRSLLAPPACPPNCARAMPTCLRTLSGNGPQGRCCIHLCHLTLLHACDEGGARPPSSPAPGPSLWACYLQGPDPCCRGRGRLVPPPGLIAQHSCTPWHSCEAAPSSSSPKLSRIPVSPLRRPAAPTSVGEPENS